MKISRFAVSNLLVFLSTIFCSNVCSAQGTLDQPPNTSLQAVIDQEIPDMPEFSTYVLSDVVVDNSGFVCNLTVYFTNFSGEWASTVTEARLTSFQDPLTSNWDPRFDGEIVPVEIRAVSYTHLTLPTKA